MDGNPLSRICNISVRNCAPNGDPTEHAGIVVGCLYGVDPTHRKAGDGPVVFTGDGTVVLVDEWDDLVHQALLIH